MVEIARRSLLKQAAVGAGGVAAAGMIGTTLTSCVAPPYNPGPLGAFDCGVASGIHAPGSMVIWTRFAPAANESMQVKWKVALDSSFTQVISHGSVTAQPQHDGCVKVLVEDLPHHRFLWYQFESDGLTSPVGRMKTQPAPGAAVDRAAFAVASCQQFTAGFFPAWAAIAQRELDAVIHLGDYIYETGNSMVVGIAREDKVGVSDTVEGYRAKYRLYRSDPDLRAAHAAHAFITVWDDHEFKDDWNRLSLIDDAERAQAAFQVWFEYQPVWPIQGSQIYRSAEWGKLVDLSMLDTRQYRDPQPGYSTDESSILGFSHVDPYRVVHDKDRTILGVPQRDWLLDRLGAAQGNNTTWKLIGNQVMISPIRAIDLDEPFWHQIDPHLPKHAGLYINFDDWDGYQWERDVVMNHLRTENIKNTVFLTGDIHMFFHAPNYADFDEPGSPVVAHEFVCGSISSRGGDVVGEIARIGEELVRDTSPGFSYSEMSHRGFGLVECTPEAINVEYRKVDALTNGRGDLPLRRFVLPVNQTELAVNE